MRKTAVITLLLAMCSCSTTKFLSEGEYRLASNSVTVTNSKEFPQSEITPYIKQQSNTYFIFGWNPFLNVYNWGDNSGKGIDKIWRKIGVPPVVFNPKLVDSSIENIESHLRYLGYYSSNVEAEVQTVRKLAKVKYVVTLGKRYQIDSISYEIPEQEEFSAVFYSDTVSHLVKPHSYLSESLLESESVRSSSVFRENGFFEFNKNYYFFVADTVSVPGKTLLKYSIRDYTRNQTPKDAQELCRYRFRDVNVSHSADVKLRESALMRMNLISPGDYYKESTVTNTYTRYSSMKLFSSVSMNVTRVDSALLDCNIKLTESNRQGFKVDLQVSTNSSSLIGISPQLTWFHKNIFGGGEWLTLGFTGNFQFKPNSDERATVVGANATLSLPTFLGLPARMFTGPIVPRTEFKLAYTYQDRPEYTRNVASMSYGYSWHTQNNLYFNLYPLQLGYVNMPRITEEFLEVLWKNKYMWDAYSDHIDMGTGGIIFKKNYTDVVPKAPYRFIQLSYDLSGNVLSLFNSMMPENGIGQRLLFNVPYAQYVRGELQAANAWRFGRNGGQAFAMRFVVGAGAAYGNSYSMPYEKQFYCGGASSMRAWQTHALGPGSAEMYETFSIPSQTGDFKMEADLEWRFKMFWKIEGAMFAEVGNVWQLSLQEKIFDTLAADWGLGIRLNMDFILIRVDGGFKVLEPSRKAGQKWLGPSSWFSKNGYAVHFGVGYPF